MDLSVAPILAQATSSGTLDLLARMAARPLNETRLFLNEIQTLVLSKALTFDSGLHPTLAASLWVPILIFPYYIVKH